MMFPTRITGAAVFLAFFAGTLLLAPSTEKTAIAQEALPAATSAVHRVALAPGTCPIVLPGDVVTLDWNPGYAPAWPVASIDLFVLHMKRSPFATGGHMDKPLVLATPFPVHPTAPAANGFFHFEMKIKERYPSGEYHVSSVYARPYIDADYSGPMPQVTNSPADAWLCINFQNSMSPSP